MEGARQYGEAAGWGGVRERASRNVELWRPGVLVVWSMMLGEFFRRVDIFTRISRGLIRSSVGEIQLQHRHYGREQ